MKSKIDRAAARKVAIEAKARSDAATVAPWIWDINRRFHDIRLVSPKNGWCIVMDFIRWGMQGAQPRFSDRGNAPLGGIMHPAEEYDRTEGGLSANPDAAFISHARTDVPALADLVLALLDEAETRPPWIFDPEHIDLTPAELDESEALFEAAQKTVPMGSRVETEAASLRAMIRWSNNVEALFPRLLAAARYALQKAGSRNQPGSGAHLFGWHTNNEQLTYYLFGLFTLLYPSIRIVAVVGGGGTIIVSHNFDTWYTLSDNGGEICVEKINGTEPPHGYLGAVPSDPRAMKNVATVAYRIWCLISGREIDWAYDATAIPGLPPEPKLGVYPV